MRQNSLLNNVGGGRGVSKFETTSCKQMNSTDQVSTHSCCRDFKLWSRG